MTHSTSGQEGLGVRLLKISKAAERSPPTWAGNLRNCDETTGPRRAFLSSSGNVFLARQQARDSRSPPVARNLRKSKQVRCTGAKGVSDEMCMDACSAHITSCRGSRAKSNPRRNHHPYRPATLAQTTPAPARKSVRRSCRMSLAKPSGEEPLSSVMSSRPHLQRVAPRSWKSPSTPRKCTVISFLSRRTYGP